MLPGDGVLRAAQRWLRLLKRSTVQQASAILRADAAYSDLSPTQYASALDWLSALGLLDSSTGQLGLSPAVAETTEAETSRLLFARSLEAAAPAWLADADTLVADPSDLPQDAADLSTVLGLDGRSALLAIRQVHGRIDLAERARIGAAGERTLAALLEATWPGSARHVALTDDGLGFDISFTAGGRTWHLEVKTTTRRGRLAIYLSRHEYEVAGLDADWQLVVVGLSNTTGELEALATVKSTVLAERAPRDHDGRTRWQSARYELSSSDLAPGLPFSNASRRLDDRQLLRRGTSRNGLSAYAWMPPPLV